MLHSHEYRTVLDVIEGHTDPCPNHRVGLEVSRGGLLGDDEDLPMCWPYSSSRGPACGCLTCKRSAEPACIQGHNLAFLFTDLLHGCLCLSSALVQRLARSPSCGEDITPFDTLSTSQL